MSRLPSVHALAACALLSVGTQPALAQFRGEYFTGTQFDTSVLIREDWTLDFDWDTGAPAPEVPADLFSIRWTARLTPNRTGTHVLHVTTDDGVRVSLDGQLVLDDWNIQSAQTNDVPIELEAGVSVELEMEYFENAGKAVARLEWTPPGGTRRLVTPGLSIGQDELTPFSAFHGGVLPPTAPGQGGLYTTPVTDSLGIGMILTITAAPSSDVLYAGSRSGQVVAVQPSDGSIASTFLDISDRVWTGQDSGLLGLAFHPEFSTPGAAHAGEVFAYYVHQSDQGDRFLRLSRFQADATGLSADADSEEILIQQRVVATLHRGGGLLFGLDGFLYLSIGDLGMSARSQQLHELFVGGVLRIDVDQDLTRSHPIGVPLAPDDPESFGQGYTIPDDNPFLGAAPDALEEVFALGCRNPHRMTLDSATGQIWIGDVGSNTGASQEEINLLAPGANFGWPFREAAQDIADRPDVVLGDLTDPVVAYPRSLGSCVIGGFVYRGTAVDWLQGRYVFGDYTNGKLYATSDDLATFDGAALGVAQAGLVTFGQDNAGELYLGAGDGVLYRVEAAPFAPEPPATLSATGLFTDLAALQPAPGFLPYEVAAPLWSDGAEKRRWFALPQDGVADTSEERIRFEMHEPWSFPAGSVFLKHFELPRPDGTLRRIETRVMVRTINESLYGVTYRWRPDGSDADLLTDALSEDIDGLTWEYPSRSDCLRCHNEAAGRVLGLRTDQLVGDADYADRSGHQLWTLRELGLLQPQPSLEALAHAPRRSDTGDLARYAHERSRSYLATNCATCHLPGGPGYGNFDARFETPLALQGLIEGSVVNDMGIPGAEVIDPGSPDTSLLLQRMLIEGPGAMPPLGRGPVHAEGTELIQAFVQASNSAGPYFQTEFFDGIDLTVPLATRSDAVVAFDWGGSSPHPGVPSNGFSARFAGTIVAPVTEPITFIATADDGVRVFVDGQLVVDDWSNHAARESRGQIFLEAGQSYPIVVEYYENGGQASLRLEWVSASRPRRVVRATDPQNGAPSAFAATHEVETEQELTFELTGSDPQGSNLDFAVVEGPEHGSLVGAGRVLSYRPDPGYVGSDRLLFQASDGDLESPVEQITIDVVCTLCDHTQVYCTAAPNSVGAGARISASGSTSVDAEDLVLHIDGSIPNDFGLFYYGPAQSEYPFGEGFRCVEAGGSEVFRLPVVMADSTGSIAYPLDYQAVKTPGWILPGSSWNFQYWYRDPSGGPVGFNLSDALAADFLP